MIKTKVYLITLIFLLATGVFAYYQTQKIPTKMTTPLNESFIVKRGSSFSVAATSLEENGVIQHALLFKLLAKQRQQDHLLKPGKYDLSQSMSMDSLLNMLTSGDVITHSVTLIEGWTFKKFKAHLATNNQLVSRIADMTDAQIMQAIGAPKLHPEGQFAPDTYHYEEGDSDLDILQRSFNRQQQLINASWKSRNPDGLLKTLQEALILASIIEKETGQGGERTKISGVFHNRLRLGMKLQTDPTVIYGMGDLYKGNIKRVHLRTDTPYNTYTRYGLPPTPIAMPGSASIVAALNPSKTKSLYFVGKGDGTHYFSKDLAEHNRAVAKYQLGQ